MFGFGRGFGTVYLAVPSTLDDLEAEDGMACVWLKLFLTGTVTFLNRRLPRLDLEPLLPVERVGCPDAAAPLVIRTRERNEFR